MSPQVRKLFDIEIDEISVVDRPANQHATVTFAKADDPQEDQMSVETELEAAFDADGNPVDLSVVERGDLIYDEEGNEYLIGTEEDAAALAEEVADDDDSEAEEISDEVGKGVGFQPNLAAMTGLYGKAKVGAGVAGGAAAAGAGALGAKKLLKKKNNQEGPMAKSFGDTVLEELSKAVTDYDRDQVIAKALNRVEEVEATNAKLSKALEEEHDARVTEAYIAKAEEYNLPVAPAVLGPILKAVAEVLSDEQLEVLDALFSSVGDALYEELGYVGDTDNASVLNQVDAYASELVGKSDMTHAQATVALFSNNPAAYDAYIAENGR